MFRFGTTELIIIMILFGVGQIGKIARELNNGIRAFNKGLMDVGEKEE